ncbi:hypothetical protein [Hoeflea sp.]|uniref:hypothetical protein n=1 Tax=Hoeflea sp. TaxID=1940281 RepID=UPI003B01384D
MAARRDGAEKDPGNAANGALSSAFDDVIEIDGEGTGAGISTNPAGAGFASRLFVRWRVRTSGGTWRAGIVSLAPPSPPAAAGAPVVAPVAAYDGAGQALDTVAAAIPIANGTMSIRTVSTGDELPDGRVGGRSTRTGSWRANRGPMPGNGSRFRPIRAGTPDRRQARAVRR